MNYEQTRNAMFLYASIEYTNGRSCLCLLKLSPGICIVNNVCITKVHPLPTSPLVIKNEHFCGNIHKWLFVN